MTGSRTWSTITSAMLVLVATSLLSTPGSAAPGDPGMRITAIDPVVEGDAGTSTPATVELRLTAPTDHEVRWRWTTFDQPDFIDEYRPTEPDVDYTSASGTAVFAPGETTTQVTVDIIGDDLFEHPEFVAIVAVPDEDPIDLSRFASGRIRVLDDDLDHMPRVIPGTAWADEADGSTAVLHLPVRLSGPTGVDVWVEWRTLNVVGAPPHQALSPDDYLARSGTVYFNAWQGVAEVVVDIPVVDDEVPEPDEYVVVSFHSPTGARMGGFWGLGFGGIVDDDS